MMLSPAIVPIWIGPKMGLKNVAPLFTVTVCVRAAAGRLPDLSVAFTSGVATITALAGLPVNEVKVADQLPLVSTVAVTVCVDWLAGVMATEMVEPATRSLPP